MEVDTYGDFADRDWSPNEKGFARMVQRIDQTVGMWWRVGTILVLVQLAVIILGRYMAPLFQGLIGG